MLPDGKIRVSANDTVYIVYIGRQERIFQWRLVSILQNTVVVKFIVVKAWGLVTISGNTLNSILSGEGSGYGIF